MGQQQLLLLVLSTVIVGLATVAGIQAFDEGQTQANQDAISQRALTIGSDIYAASQKPSQLGGITLGSTGVDAIASAAGYGDSGTGISVDGASGTNPVCDIVNESSTTKVKCGTNGSTDGTTVVAEVTSGNGPSLVSINGNSVTQ